MVTKIKVTETKINKILNQAGVLSFEEENLEGDLNITIIYLKKIIGILETAGLINISIDKNWDCDGYRWMISAEMLVTKSQIRKHS